MIKQSIAAQQAKDVMTSNPIVCLDSAAVYEAVTVMSEQDCGIIPIVNADGQCIGVITDRDICLRVVLCELNPLSTPLRHVMTPNLVTCAPNEDLDTIIQRMETHQIRRILVLDADRQCVGVISEGDIALRDIDRSQVAELVEAVCEL